MASENRAVSMQGAPAKAYGEVSDSQNSHARGLWLTGREASKGGRGSAMAPS
jgi:hypothetical protein